MAANHGAMPIICLLEAQVMCCAGAKNYDQAAGAAGALGWRLTSDEMAALDSASERAPTAQGLPFENW